MAECFEVLREASLEEQQDEITVLQSIFENDLQMIEGGDGKSNICFNLTVKVNIPRDVIGVEAFISVDVFEGLPRGTSKSGGIESDSERGNYRKEGSKSESSSNNLNNESHLDVQENGDEASCPEDTAEDKENQAPRPQSSHGGFSRRTYTEPGFTRSVSLQHWHVKADIRHLTPIHLTCTFPPFYPTKCPPEFSLASLWLSQSQIQRLQEKLMQLWTETPNLPIVFTWVDWLQNYAYDHLQLGSHLVLKDSEPYEVMPQSQADAAANSQFRQREKFNTKLETALLTIFEYDLKMQRQAIRQGKHWCEICFDERDGAEFHYLDECRHFFCIECLKAHCELQVDSGNVLNLLCPSHDCKTTIPPEMLREVLTAEKLERWERLLLSKTLDVMGGVVYCPRCNVAVIADEDVTFKLGRCANCFFAFCTECYEPWHHGLPCGEEAESDSDDEDNRGRKPSEEQEAHPEAADRTRSCHRCHVKKDKTEFHYLYECRHFFCTPCLKRYCQRYVDGGQFLKNLKCPGHDCQARISIEILRDVLDEERFKRYEKLFLVMTLEDLGIADVDFCPRCTVAFVPDVDEDLACGQCANCLYEFCTECYEPWHPGRPCLGEAESHSVDKEKLKSNKGKGDGEEEGDSAVAVSNGKQRIQKAHKMSNLSFIRLMRQQGTYQSCPKCRMAVERISGCDMMHCSQCSASFCWTCGM